MRGIALAILCLAFSIPSNPPLPPLSGGAAAVNAFIVLVLLVSTIVCIVAGE